MKNIRTLLILLGTVSLVLAVIPYRAFGHQLALILFSRLVIGIIIAVLSYRYANHLGRSGLAWGISAFLFPFIAPILLAFLKDTKTYSYSRPVVYTAAPEESSKPVIESPPAGQKISIPKVTPEHLSVSLIESSTLGDAGPGGVPFQQAIQNLNRQDYDGAADCFREALKAGLDQLRQGYAHANLGTIMLKKRDLAGAVKEFFAVFELKQALYESAHDAARNLGIILEEIGRKEEAAALGRLAGITSARLGYGISPDAAEKVRSLARSASIEEDTPETPVAVGAPVAAIQNEDLIGDIIARKNLRPLGNKKRLGSVDGKDCADYRAQFRGRASAERYYDAFVTYAEKNPPPMLIEVMVAYTPNTIYAEKYSFILPYFNVGIREDYQQWARDALLDCNDVLRQHSYCAGNSYEHVPKSIGSDGAVIKWTIILPEGFDPKSPDAEELLSDPPELGYPEVNIEGQNGTVPERPEPLGPWIGVLFEIAHFDEALYGRAATALLFKTVGSQYLAGSVIHGGDIIPECTYWCSAVHTASFRQLERIEQAMSASGDKKLAPVEARFLKGSEVPVHTLPYQGFVDDIGNYIGV